jgi:hypothetical protein
MPVITYTMNRTLVLTIDGELNGRRNATDY